MEVQAGDRVGRYEIQSLIGIGGMGEVYRALDTELDRPVALKFLPAEFALHPNWMNRFIQEAKAASALNHPNIITVYEIGRLGEGDGATPYFVTEFIDGVTLKEHLSSSKVKLGEVVEIISQVASALVAAHAAGIVHRDIKPENIMVRHDGYIKILDFGLAKPTERQSNQIDSEAKTRAFVNTDPGTIMGTVSYMSPEQAKGSALDARTDIWSVGVVLFELITGDLPFKGATPNHVIVSLLEDEPPLLSNYIPEVPEALELIVEEALRKDRDERTQSAKQLLGNLRRLKQRVDAEAELDRTLSPAARASDPGSPRATGSRRGLRSTGERPTRTVASLGDYSTLATEASKPNSVIAWIKQRTAWAFAILALATFAFAAGAFGLYRLYHRFGPTASRPAMKISRLTANGRASHAVISRDGKYIAHVLATGDKQSLLLRQAETTSTREIVPPAVGYFLGVTFTPDGNYLYYVFGEHGKNVRTLYRVSQMGGDVRQLLYDVDSPVSFSPDGKQIAFIRGFFKEREKALFVAAADGSGETRLSTRKAPEFTAMDEPAWSPDGTRIAFIVGGVDSEGYYINIDAVAIQDKTESKISSDRWRNISSIAWLSHSSGLIASARERAAIAGSPEQIWRISSPDGAAQQLTTDLNYYSSVSIADSNKVVATVRNQEAHIWIAPSGNSEKARQVSSNSFSGLWGLAWAPDGRLVYTASERENRDIWISNADGSNEKQLTFETAADLNPFVSPDSRYIVFLSNRGVGWGIWRMHLDGTNPKELVRNIQEYGIPMVSRDSRWVIYSADNAGRPALWKISIDGGTPVLLADKHLYGATLSPDGKSIAYYYRPPELGAELQIEIISSEGGAPYKTFPAPGDGYRMRWSPDGSAIDYVHTREGVSNLWRVPINGGQPKQLTNWTAEQIFWFAWSDDGKALGCARGAFLSDLVLIENLNVVQ